MVLPTSLQAPILGATQCSSEQPGATTAAKSNLKEQAGVPEQPQTRATKANRSNYAAGQGQLITVRSSQEQTKATKAIKRSEADMKTCFSCVSAMCSAQC